jgi:hypothetical protein
MKVTKIKVMLLCFLFASQACVTTSPISHPKFYNFDEFIGFVSMDSENDRVKLDYELDGANGHPVLFNDCDDVMQTPETAIATHQYHLWRLMQINCKSITMLTSADSSNRSYWPPKFDKTFIAELPATAIPDLGGSSPDERKGILKDIEPSLEINSINSHSAKAIVSGDLDITYVLMARGDFNHDGIEDILLRLDWNIINAFGKGFSLLLLSKTGFSAEAKIVWRDG